MKLLLATFALLLVVSLEAREMGFRRFNGFQVITVETRTAEQFEVLKEIYNMGELDFWTSPRGLGLTDIMVDPVQLYSLAGIFDKHGMTYTVKIEDVEKLVQEDREANLRNLKAAGGKMTWTAYPRYAEIEDWLVGEVSASPIANVSIIGKTYEGRNMYVVKLSSGGSAPKKSLLIDANIHAREWISGATATWLINEMITNSADYATILSQLDIYIIPFINVDGYEYCHTGDRLWRKTRSVNAGSTCLGCDPNRNFGFQFGGEGTSALPCSDTFKGPAAFSEVETAAVRDFVLDREAAGVKFNAYLTFHSYGQYWLLPWGYTAGVYPPDYAEQLTLGRAAIAALRQVSNTNYETGQGADVLYGVGGASDDWAKNHGIKYTVTVEMRDTGRSGFVLPATQIIPNAQEILEAVKVVIGRILIEE